MNFDYRNRARLAVMLSVMALVGPGTFGGEPPVPPWDNFSDTWVATDALGRSLPTNAEVGNPRPNRYVGIFYFLWLGRHGEAGPFDITKILAANPAAMTQPASPPWGPLHAFHHWGESLFGYYVSDDEGVIRKHAQMLADAGVDVVIFDVTNGWTYPESYQALLRIFADVRRHGGRTPQVAFLCPFGNPHKVVDQLWRDLYAPGLHPELWFCWDNKPLLLADPAWFEGDIEGMDKHNVPAPLHPGHTLGQSFTVDKPFRAVAGSFPTWNTSNAAVTLTLRRQGASGEPIILQQFENVADNAWLTLRFDPPQPAGTYLLEASAARGTVGWWSEAKDAFPRGAAFADGAAVPGDRTLRISVTGGTNEHIRNFFTFRKPQPDYFKGSTGPDQWSWLEISPQHTFTNAHGGREMMSVGVAQNAVGRRLGSMSEPDAKGRSFHHGAMDQSPGAVNCGLNFAEQWERALAVDPDFIFITGWNEWVANRYNEFGGVKHPVMFVDTFDQEHSRDVEPMRGGHGDNYYYQMTAAIRRYKGVRPLAPIRSHPIQIDGRFDDWQNVELEFRDDRGDPAQRNHRGWSKETRYVNQTGRNDIVAAKVSYDARNVYFYVRTAEPLTPPGQSNWMLLFLDTDGNHTNGWLGYDFVVNRSVGPAQTTSLEQHHRAPKASPYSWQPLAQVEYRMAGNELELAIPRTALGLDKLPAVIDFKWADNIQQTGDWSDFTLNGDAAPNDRFNYRAKLESAPAP
ncbi:MAG: hypothetical protein WCO56_15445 [Verrucomicrobiota bacterium]